MKILVCISNVPDTTSKITFTDNHTQFNKEGVQFIINPYDEIALSKAIELKESISQSSVTVISVAEASADATIRKALAIGADSAIRIDAIAKDAWYVASQIAHYARQQSFDLILTGRESIDYNGGQVTAMIAELLNIPSVSTAKEIHLQEDNTVTIAREIEGGKQLLTTSLPVVIGTAEGVAEPKIPNVRNIMSARSKPLEVIAPLDIENLTTISTYAIPPKRGDVQLIDENNLEQLVELLHAQVQVI